MNKEEIKEGKKLMAERRAGSARFVVMINNLGAEICKDKEIINPTQKQILLAAAPFLYRYLQDRNFKIE